MHSSNSNSDSSINLNKNEKDLVEHKWIKISLLTGTILLYVIMVGFNALASTGTSKPLFNNSVGAISDILYSEIVPAGWVFSLIWTTIFVWQFVWLFYALICLFRRNENHELLYLKFDFIHYGILIAFAVNNAAIIAWLFLWDNLIVGWALFMIVAATLALHVCLFISFRRGYSLREKMIAQGYKKDVWLNRFIVQNGLGFFVTWLSLASNLNFANFLTFSASVPQENSSTLALVIIIIVVVTYFVLENFIWQRYLVYMFTPWFVVIVALIGSLTKNWNQSSPKRNNIITLIFLLIILCLFAVKMIMFVLYHTKLKHKLYTKRRDRKIRVNSPVKNLNERPPSN